MTATTLDQGHKPNYAQCCRDSHPSSSPETANVNWQHDPMVTVGPAPMSQPLNLGSSVQVGKACHFIRHLIDFFASVFLLRCDNEWHLQLGSVFYLGDMYPFGKPSCVPPGLQLLQRARLPTPWGYHLPMDFLWEARISTGTISSLWGTRTSFHRPVCWINDCLENPPQRQFNPRLFHRNCRSPVSHCLTHTAVETNSIDKPAVVDHYRDKGPIVIWTDVLCLCSGFLAPDFVQGRNIHKTSEFPLVSGNFLLFPTFHSGHQSHRSASLCSFSKGTITSSSPERACCQLRWKNFRVLLPCYLNQSP